MSEQPARTPGAQASSSLPPTLVVDSFDATPAGGGSGDTLTTPPADRVPAGTARVGRYRLLGELGHGGMGVVLRAFDPDLKRTLAVKILLPEFRGHPVAERRFLEEAQVTGQLQHPGVAPVHEIGRLEDGRPFIAMKLIEGHSLDQLLKDRPSPAADLSRFVAVFGQICQTLAYAHSRGVIHRDLKPANVIVGAFGEVQVMDWGLAKVLGSADDADQDAVEVRAIHTLRSDEHVDFSRCGSILGTPPFMAPEQARGEGSQLDERSDVFGLGAVLCVILTGEPPFRGPDASSVLLQAARGNLDDALARLLGCGADAELVRLALRCLAAEREERPRNAGEVAAAVGAYQAGVQEQLRQAELERARAEVKAREERKRRRLVLALALTLGVVLVLGGLFARWAELKQKELAYRKEHARQGVERTLAEARALRRRALWSEAEDALANAEDMAGSSAGEEMSGKVEHARANLHFVERLDRIRENRSLILDDRPNTTPAPAAYEKAFRQYGLNVLEGAEQPWAERLAASDIRDELIAALDDWAFTETDGARRSRLWRLTGLVRKEEGWRQRLADPRLWDSRPRFERLLGEMDLRRVVPPILVGLGTRLEELGGDGLTFLKRGCPHHPGDFWLNLELATLLHAKQRWGEATGYYRAALAARPRSAAAYVNLGTALRRLGRLEEAEAYIRRGIELDPRLARAHTALGKLLRERKDLAGAVHACHEAVALAPQDGAAHYHLAAVLHALNRRGEAAAVCRRAVELNSRKPAFHALLGQVLFEQGDFQAARQAGERVLRLTPVYAPLRYWGVSFVRKCMHFEEAESKRP